MSEKKRPNYTKEFKQDAIKLVIEQLKLPNSSVGTPLKQ